MLGLSSDNGAIDPVRRMSRVTAARTEGAGDKGTMWNSGPISWERVLQET